MHLSQSTDATISGDDRAAPDEALVDLWLVKTPENRPDSGDRGGDVMHRSGAALRRARRLVFVVARHLLRYLVIVAPIRGMQTWSSVVLVLTLD
jgi:hypothetical protein